MNSGAGIIVNRETPVLNNQCARNGGPGIQAASANTISGNLSAVNGTGYLVTGSENLLTGNFARGNGLNWDIAGGNGCRVAVVSDTGAFSGNSGGTAVGASDPFLNFTQ